MKAMVSDMDNFHCEFPQNATPVEKTLLMCSVILLDMVYFEEGAKNKGHHGHHWYKNYRSL